MILAAALITVGGATTAAAGPGGNGSHRASPSLASPADEVCDGLPETRRKAYGWPVKPFHRQHAVRGHFGDPRIGGRISADPMTRPRAFHFGVDVAAPPF